MYNSYNLPPEAAGNAIMGILLGLAVFSVILIPIIIVLYILGSLGTMNIAKRENEENPWFAWVPVASSYLLCKMAFKNKKIALWYVIIPLITGILGGNYTVNGKSAFKSNGFLLIINEIFKSLNGIVSLAVLVIFFIIVYKIYSRYSEQAVGMLIGSILTLGILSPIFLFAIRNNPRIDEENKFDNVENDS